MAEAVNLGTIYSLAELRLGEWNRGFATITRDAAAFKSLKMAQVPTLDASKFGASLTALKASTTTTLSAIKTQFATHNAQTLAAAQNHARQISRAAEDEKTGVLRAARARIAEEKTLTTSAKLTIIHEAQDRARQISRAAADEKAAVLLQAKETTTGLKLQLAEQTTAAIEAAKAQKKAFDDHQQRREKQGETLKNIGQGATNTAIAAGGGAALLALNAGQEAAKYDRTARFAATNLDYTPAQLKQLEQQVLNVSKDRRILQKPEQLMDAMYDISSTPRFATNPALAMETLKYAAYAATAGNTDVKTMAKAGLAAMEARVKGADTPKQTFDTIFQGVKSGQMRPEQLGNIGDMLVQGRLLGRSLQEQMAGLAMLTAQGLSTDEAVTTQKNLFQRIRTPSPASRSAMDALGVKYGAHAMDEQGLAGYLEDLKERMQAYPYKSIAHGIRGRMPISAPEDILGAIMPEIRGQTAEAILLGNLKNEQGKGVGIDTTKFSYYMGEMNKAQQGGGALSRSLDLMAEGPAAAMDRLAKSINRIEIAVGMGVTPAMEKFAGWIESVIAQFDKLTPKQQSDVGQNALFGGGALAALGALLTVPGGKQILGVGSKGALDASPLLSLLLGKQLAYNYTTNLLGKPAGGGAGGVDFADPTRGDSSAGLRSNLTQRGNMSRLAP